MIARNDLLIIQVCLVTEISVNNEKCLTSLYRCLNQSHEELDTFCSKLDLLFSNINDNHPT